MAGSDLYASKTRSTAIWLGLFFVLALFPWWSYGDDLFGFRLSGFDDGSVGTAFMLFLLAAVVVGLGLVVRFEEDESFVDEHYDQVCEVFVRGGNSVPFRKRRALEYFRHLRASGNLIAASVYLPTGECIATSTFSSAVIWWNSRMFWNVRAIPSAMMRSGRRAVMLRPSNSIRPKVGL